MTEDGKLNLSRLRVEANIAARGAYKQWFKRFHTANVAVAVADIVADCLEQQVDAIRDGYYSEDKARALILAIRENASRELDQQLNDRAVPRPDADGHSFSSGG